MRRRSFRVAVFSLLWLIGLVVIGAGALYWRLTQGPMSLAFLGNSIEQAIDRQLPEFKISLGETELELDPDTKTPNVRVRNITLRDASGQIIASAPKAGVSIDSSGLMSGSINITTLDLIGPRISVRRNLDGSLQLGIANDLVSDEKEIVLEQDLEDGNNKSNLGGQGAGVPQKQLVSGSKILELLDAGGEVGSLAKLQEVRLSRGALQLYDEANDATWTAPKAELAFRRTASGFVLAAKADVASGGDPWKIESSITFRKSEKNFTANVVFENLVPANVADEVFALAQFARLSTPLSGNFELEAEETGKLTKLEGQLFAAAGQISLPEYVANPIIIDEGAIRIRQLGFGAPYEILESSILLGSSRADLKGKIAPRAAEGGRVTAYDIDLAATNLSVDTQGTVVDPLFVDRVSYKGSFGVEEQRVDIEDLVIMAGTAGVRLRGAITSGEDSAGIQASGRLRDVNSGLLKKLWPPILAPKTRSWINENVVAGKISDGEFELNFAPNELAKAQRARQLPASAVKLKFSMRDVVTRYFKQLPELQGASGSALLSNAKFGLTLDKGFVTLPSGRKLGLAEGRFEADELLAVEVPGSFRFDIQGGVAEMLEYASLPDLNLVKDDLTALPRIEGSAQAIVGIKLPLIKGVPRSRVTVTQEVKLIDASVKNILPGVDLTDGDFAIDAGKDMLSVSGPSKLNGVAAKIDWRKPRTGGEAKVAVETTLTEKMREKLGIKLGAYMSGDVPVKLAIASAKKDSRRIAVEADLSDVSMKVAAAGFRRNAIPGTRATFTYVENAGEGKRIEDLTIKGKGLTLRGNVSMSATNALRVLDLDEVRLSEDDVFSIRMAPGDGVTKLTIGGNSFDARPYIKNLMSPAATGDATNTGPKGGDFVITARFNSVTAFRGEDVRDVTATFSSVAGKIVEAEMSGKFASGFPITLSLKPVAGGREMRVTSTDGGAALRAADFYGKVAGGNMQFYALMANEQGSPIRNGSLDLRRFAVRNEATLAELDERGKPKKSGPRVGGVSFKRLTIPFTTDSKFVRLCGIELKGDEIGAKASGIIRKSDKAMDVTGAYFPLHGINRALGQIPLFGELLTGGRGEGVIGLTFAVGGTLKEPKTQVNPLSFLAVGVLRKLFEFEQRACGRAARRANAAN